MSRTLHRPQAIDAGFIVTIVASTFLMGSSFVAGKILLGEGFSPMILVGWRFVVAALVTLPLVYFDNRRILNALIPPGLTLRDGSLVIVIGLSKPPPSWVSCSWQ